MRIQRGGELRLTAPGDKKGFRKKSGKREKCVSDSTTFLQPVRRSGSTSCQDAADGSTKYLLRSFLTQESGSSPNHVSAGERAQSCRSRWNAAVIWGSILFLPVSLSLHSKIRFIH